MQVWRLDDGKCAAALFEAEHDSRRYVLWDRRGGRPIFDDSQRQTLRLSPQPCLLFKHLPFIYCGNRRTRLAQIRSGSMQLLKRSWVTPVYIQALTLLQNISYGWTILAYGIRVLADPLDV